MGEDSLKYYIKEMPSFLIMHFALVLKSFCAFCAISIYYRCECSGICYGYGAIIHQRLRLCSKACLKADVTNKEIIVRGEGSRRVLGTAT